MYNLNHLIDVIAIGFGIEAFYVQENQIYDHEGHIFCNDCPLGISHECLQSWKIGGSISKQLNGPYTYFCPLGLSFVIVSNKVISQCLRHDFLVAGPIVVDEEKSLFGSYLQTRISKDAKAMKALQSLPHRSEDVLFHIADGVFLAYKGTVYINTSENLEIMAKESDAAQQAIPMETGHSRHSLFSYLHHLAEMLFGTISGDSSDIDGILSQMMNAIRFEEYSDLSRVKQKCGQVLIYLYGLYKSKGFRNQDVSEAQILFEVNHLTKQDSLEGVGDRFAQAVYLLYRNQNHAVSVSENPLARQIQDIVAQRYATPITLTDIAKEMNVSYSHLSMMINKTLGKGFNQYLKEVRVQASKTLLCRSTLSIAEISHNVGFVDQSHFAKSFRSICGVSPQQYRATKAPSA